MTCRPESYAQRDLHRTVRPPAICPFCQAPGSLEAHGYYHRDTTNSEGTVLKIQVRRFRCRRCRKAVSCLPGFAQPYLVVNSTTIDAYFNGHRTSHGIEANTARLESYWHRFTARSRGLCATIGQSFGPAPPTAPLALWRRLRRVSRGLARCTLGLVRDFGVTLFGTFRCHRRPARADPTNLGSLTQPVAMAPSPA